MADEKPAVITVNGVEITDTYVHMRCDSLARLPQWMGSAQLPPGFHFRSYQRGDEEAWTNLHRAAEPFLTVTDDMFEQQFGGAEEKLPGRMFLIENATGEVIGSGTAWMKEEWQGLRDWGKVHWIVIRPEYQGTGLFRPLMAQVMQRLAELHERAQLGTSTGRIWAIKGYLNCSFVPDPVELEDKKIRQAWTVAQQVLQHERLEEALTRRR